MNYSRLGIGFNESALDTAANVYDRSKGIYVFASVSPEVNIFAPTICSSCSQI